MADRQLVQLWLNKADEDFGFAESSLKDSPYYAQICFHFQQAAEKYLKAVIIAYDLKFEKQHNLVALLDMCGEKAPSLLSLRSHCEFLTTLYIDTRYPVLWPVDHTKNTALKAQEAASAVSAAVKSLLHS